MHHSNHFHKPYVNYNSKIDNDPRVEDNMICQKLDDSLQAHLSSNEPKYVFVQPHKDKPSFTNYQYLHRFENNDGISPFESPIQHIDFVGENEDPFWRTCKDRATQVAQTNTLEYYTKEQKKIEEEEASTTYHSSGEDSYM